jgi:hypothetical protein
MNECGALAEWQWQWQGRSRYSESNLSECHFIHHKSLMAWATDWTGPLALNGRRLAAWTSCPSVPDSRKTTIQSSIYRDVVVKWTKSTRAFDMLTYGMWNCTYRSVKQDSSVSTTIVAWKSNKYNIFSGCICNFRLFSVQCECCLIVVCGLPSCTKLFHIVINGMIFERNLLNAKRVFWFSLQLLFETFFALRRTERDMIKYLY